MGESLRDDLLEEIDKLPSEAQGKVLAFVRSLRAEPLEGTLGTDLARFAGTLPAEDAAEMLAAVEEDCRQIDHERW